MENISPDIENLAIIHPMVVHFPITYVLTALLFELIQTFTGNKQVKVFAEWMVYLGAVSSIAAVSAGYLAAETLGHDAPGHDLVHIHRNIMVSMTVGLVSIAIALASFQHFRNGPLRKALVIALVVLTGMMAFGADKGGQLVYQHGTGVNPKILKTPGVYEPGRNIENNEHHDNPDANTGNDHHQKPKLNVDPHYSDGHSH